MDAGPDKGAPTGDWASFTGKKWHWAAKSTGLMTSEADSTLQ
jgi:hypothetical protein